MRLKPVRSATVVPTCLLPENFTGEWINTANIDADVFINSTHIKGMLSNKMLILFTNFGR